MQTTKADARTRSRLPDKTIWTFEDLSVMADKLEQSWDRLLTYSERHTDVEVARELARMRDVLADLDEYIKVGRAGGYAGNR